MLKRISGGLDVLASAVEEMKGFLESTLARLDASDLKEEGTGGKNRRKEPFSAPPKAICALSHQRVIPNPVCVCVLTPKDKRPANATFCTVDMDVIVADNC